VREKLKSFLAEGEVCPGEGRVDSWGFLKQRRVRKSGNYYPHPEGDIPAGKLGWRVSQKGSKGFIEMETEEMEIKCMYSVFLVDYV
jgi:hypothetical protein